MATKRIPIRSTDVISSCRYLWFEEIQSGPPFIHVSVWLIYHRKTLYHSQISWIQYCRRVITSTRIWGVPKGSEYFSLHSLPNWHVPLLCSLSETNFHNRKFLLWHLALSFPLFALIFFRIQPCQYGLSSFSGTWWRWISRKMKLGTVGWIRFRRSIPWFTETVGEHMDPNPSHTLKVANFMYSKVF